MKDRVVAELMKRVGMENFWNEIGKQAQVKLHLEKQSDRETTGEVQSRLNAIMCAIHRHRFTFSVAH